MADRNEPVQQVNQRRDGVLQALVGNVPFARFLNITFDRRGDELTAVMAFDPKLIGSVVANRLHGGGSSAFLETTAIITLAWQTIWQDMEDGKLDLTNLDPSTLPALPKTIDFSVDYLRPGLPRDAYARATVNRSGRRYASVHVEAWQDTRSKLFIQATGHFLMPAKLETPTT